MVIVKCWRCGKKYERFNLGTYGYPYLCDKCKASLIPIKEVQK